MGAFLSKAPLVVALVALLLAGLVYLRMQRVQRDLAEVRADVDTVADHYNTELLPALEQLQEDQARHLQRQPKRSDAEVAEAMVCAMLSGGCVSATCVGPQSPGPEIHELSADDTEASEASEASDVSDADANADAEEGCADELRDQVSELPVRA